MRRPSYLQQVAAPAPRRGGMAVLSPPRTAFRPGTAEFNVEETRPTVAAPSRQAITPAPPAATPAASRVVEIMPPAPPDFALPPAPSPRDAPAPDPEPVQATREPDERGQGPSAPPAVVTPPPQRPPAQAAGAAEASRETRAPPPAIAPTLEPSVGPGPPSHAPNEAATTPTETRARPREIDLPPAAALAAIQPVPPPPAQQTAAPPLPAAAMPIVTPSPPPPRAPAPTARERTPAGLHIGTLEVRIVAPNPAPIPSPAPRAAPSRAAPRAPAVRVGGIARGFSVFGLGQS